ncbi:MAG: hypothetical protein LC634_04375 [Sphingomonadales bacterium]|nr:hypothetical protein [Sphingomonadales bacterium]
MARFPKVQSPCPYRDRLAAVMEGDFCRMCKRQVHDLTAMSDGERSDFLARCSDEICVSYSLRPAVAAVAMAAAVALPSAASAQDGSPFPTLGTPTPASLYIIVGGIKDLDAVEYVEDGTDDELAELPVTYEMPTDPIED